MRATEFKTLSVPSSGSMAIPAFVQAGGEPLRVLIRNVGATLIVISLSAQSFVQAVPSNDTYQIPTGQSDSIVLAPNQTLVMASVGANGTASVSISEAIPTLPDLRS
jgi:hypothetical protein